MTISLPNYSSWLIGLMLHHAEIGLNEKTSMNVIGRAIVSKYPDLANGFTDQANMATAATSRKEPSRTLRMPCIVRGLSRTMDSTTLALAVFDATGIAPHPRDILKLKRRGHDVLAIYKSFTVPAVA